MNPVGEELEFEREEPGVRSEAIRSEAIGEPGVYKLDPVVETEQGAGPMERESIQRDGDGMISSRICATVATGSWWIARIARHRIRRRKER